MTDDSNDSTASADRQKTTRLPIPRMNCPWAARRIAEYLQGVDGVVETYLEPRSDTVVVRYGPALTSEAAITAAAESPKPGSTGGRKQTRTHATRHSGGCRCCGGSRRR